MSVFKVLVITIICFVMIRKLMLVCAAIFCVTPFSFTYTSESTHVGSEFSTKFEDYITLFYDKLQDDEGRPAFNVFKKAITGFFHLKTTSAISNNLLTVIDFSMSSNEERLWIIDVDNMKVVHQSLVSHGQNSGELFATKFSNTPSSYQSSLGFYVTGNIYYGRHGMSLYLDGMEEGINDKARQRTIVMHSADYVSYDFIQRNGRLGRSHGCPAIPQVDHERIIRELAGGSCLYIYHPEKHYHQKTKLQVPEKAIEGLSAFFTETPSFLASNPELKAVLPIQTQM